MNSTVILIVVGVFVLAFTVLGVLMVAAALGRRHHREKDGRAKKR